MKLSLFKSHRLPLSSPLSHALCEAFSPKSDSELVVRPSESLLRAESHMQWTWGEFPETTRVRASLLCFEERTFPGAYHLTRPIPVVQFSKKEKPEALKTVTITPSESTHFRVILSSEAMQNETHLGTEDDRPECTVVKPEPRAAVTPMDPLASISTACSLSPISPTESVDVMLPNVATSTPSSSQHSDSPSKKKGGLSHPLPPFFPLLCSTSTDKVFCWIKKKKGVPKRSQHQGPEDIYLDDLNVLEPDVAARYFPKRSDC